MMTDQEFDKLVALAQEELSRKNDLLTKQYGLSYNTNFSFDQNRCELTFRNAIGQTSVKMSVLEIANFFADSNTWCWAWANRSISDAARQRCESLQELYHVTGKDMFRTSVITADEVMAWGLTSVAVKHLNSIGAYCMPVPGKYLKVFVSIEKIRKAPGKAEPLHSISY
jgi:hypothetical protein